MGALVKQAGRTRRWGWRILLLLLPLLGLLCLAGLLLVQGLNKAQPAQFIPINLHSTLAADYRANPNPYSLPGLNLNIIWDTISHREPDAADLDERRSNLLNSLQTPVAYTASSTCQGSYTIYPHQDTWLDSANPTTAYGAETRLYLGREDSRIKRLLLYFAINEAIPAGTFIQQAHLEMKSTEPIATVSPAVSLINLTGPFTEATTTWANQPESYLPYRTTEQITGNIYTWDVTDIINDWLSNRQPAGGLVLEPAPALNTTLSFYSREAKVIETGSAANQPGPHLTIDCGESLPQPEAIAAAVTPTPTQPGSILPTIATPTPAPVTPAATIPAPSPTAIASLPATPTAIPSLPATPTAIASLPATPTAIPSLPATPTAIASLPANTPTPAPSVLPGTPTPAPTQPTSLPLPTATHTPKPDDPTKTATPTTTQTTTSTATAIPTNTATPTPLPSLSINDASVIEGSAGTVNALFTVSLAGDSSHVVTVNYTTADNTATTPVDYTASSGALTFAPGVTTQPITVVIQSDTIDEPNETFWVNLSSVNNAAISDGQGVGTIIDDDLTGGDCLTPTTVLTTVADAAIYSNQPNNSFGTATNLETKPTSSNPINSLIRFDLGSIPANVTITCAALQLYQTSVPNNGQNINLYRLTNAWTETQATWNQRQTGASWNTAGGDFDSALVASFVPNTANQRVNLTSLAQFWLGNPGLNNGLLLQAQDVGNNANITYASRENGSNPPPRLAVEYTANITNTGVIASKGISSSQGGEPMLEGKGGAALPAIYLPLITK